jgi:hypothetical protein
LIGPQVKAVASAHIAGGFNNPQAYGLLVRTAWIEGDAEAVAGHDQVSEGAKFTSRRKHLAVLRHLRRKIASDNTS